MPKISTVYICTNCHAQAPKWAGRCSECGAWGTYREDVEAPQTNASSAKNLPLASVIDLSSISGAQLTRMSTGMSECDRTLGGGIVPGSLILIGGEPGICKSTLILQIANAVAGTLYVSGEESAQQIKARLERLAVTNGNIKLIAETNIERVIATVTALKPALVLIDSIQTMHSAEVETESGSVNQIRARTVKLLQMAKEQNVPVIITGHITKDGTLAGPKTLEHLVDTVVYLEQNRNNDFCILRTAKNRFGSTDEIGLLEMTATGFREVKNPSGIFLDKLQPVNGRQTGTAVSCV